MLCTSCPDGIEMVHYDHSLIYEPQEKAIPEESDSEL